MLSSFGALSDCVSVCVFYSYYHAVVTDYRERLAEVAVQVLIVTLDSDSRAPQTGAAEAEVRLGSTTDGIGLWGY